MSVVPTVDIRCRARSAPFDGSAASGHVVHRRHAGRLNRVLYAWLHQAHAVLAWGLAGMIALHLAGALHHAFIRKDGVFSAMIGRKTGAN